MTDTITLYTDDNETLIDDSEMEARYDDYLDEFGPVTIGSLEYSASRVLKEVDPIAYRVGLSDYSSEYTEHNVPLDVYQDPDFDAEEWLSENNG